MGKQHYVKVHAVKVEACEGCGQKFGSSTYLELHKKTCGQSFSCTGCGLSFPALESLQTHARRKGHPFPSSNHPKKSRKSWQTWKAAYSCSSPFRSTHAGRYRA